jgi:hypothetical protein
VIDNGETLLVKKESIVVGAAAALVLYTLALVALGPVVSSALTGSKTVSNAGSVKGVGVGIYSDQACTSAISSINWGMIDPGSNVNKTVYIRNEGTTTATLSMTTSNWNPANASSYMTLSWNYGGQSLNVNQVIQIKLTLSVSVSVKGITSFSFDITITATSQ